jgi:hypothetical protein
MLFGSSVSPIAPNYGSQPWTFRQPEGTQWLITQTTVETEVSETLGVIAAVHLAAIVVRRMQKTIDQVARQAGCDARHPGLEKTAEFFRARIPVHWYT